MPREVATGLASRGAGDARHWWRAPWAVERFLADLVDLEGRLMRPGGTCPPRLLPAQVAATGIGEGGLGFDSLEQLGLAAAVSEALHLHEGGLTDTFLTAPTFAGWLDAALVALDHRSDHVTIRSSGSGGRRRSHTHQTWRLAQEAVAWAQRFADRRRIRSAVASHHIYGLLFTLMVAAELDLPVDDLRGLSPGGVLGSLQPGDLVIGHPVFWDALLRASPIDWRSDVVGVTSGATCTDSTATALGDAGLARLLDVYGSSETGGIGWRERTPDGWGAGRGAHRLLPFWRRTSGDLLVRGDDSPIDPPDRLHWTEAGGFRVGARRDGAVMVGGVAVDLERVGDLVRAHPGVAEVAVRLMHPSEGVRLKAYVVPRSADANDWAALRISLAAHIDAVMSVAERPRALLFGLALPLSPSGKPADWPVGESPY